MTLRRLATPRLASSLENILNASTAALGGRARAAAAPAASPRAMAAPPPPPGRAIVRSLPDHPTLTISLTVSGRARAMERPKDELLERPLARLQRGAAPPPPRRRPGAAAADAPAEPPLPFVGLHAGATPDTPLLDPAAVTNEAAWRGGRLLRVGDAAFAVSLNPPAADALRIHPGAFVGVPLAPVPELQFAELEACEWAWARRAPGAARRAGGAGGAGGKKGKKGAASAAPPADAEAGWEPIPGAAARSYAPAPGDAGFTLRATCTPGRRATSGARERGAPVSAEAGPVAAPPAPPAGAARAAATALATVAPRVRLVCYNLLADQYAATARAKEVLFAHCPPAALAPPHRRPLALAELLGYRADVAALQEVDARFFEALLAPALGDAGFEGAYLNKAGKVAEGAAVFWRRDRFALAARRDVVMKELFPAAAGGAAKYAAPLAPLLDASPALREALQRVGTVAQLLLLAPTDAAIAAAAAAAEAAGGPAAEAAAAAAATRPLLLVNTHLFYHARAPHVRSLHVWAMLQEAAELAAAAQSDPALAAACRGARPALVFCGDLNSDINDGIPGAVELLRAGRLPARWWDWAAGARFAWGAAARGEGGEGADGDGDGDGNGDGDGDGDGDAAAEDAGPAVDPSVSAAAGALPTLPAVVGLDLASPFGPLAAADGMATPFTNFVRGYRGLLDYVWASPADAVAAALPPPGEAELGGFLPNARFPSDHLAVVAELELRADGGDIGSGVRAGDSDSGAGAAGGGAGGEAGGAVEGGDGDAPVRVQPAAPHTVPAAVAALAAGRLIAVPTDTLYGLAADAASAAAVDALYAAKRRDDAKPVAIAVADVADVARYARIEHLPAGLLEALLPGPVTLLLARAEGAPLAPRLRVAALGVRVPAHAWLRAAARTAGGALALTSANVSGERSSVTVGEFRPLWPRCAAVFDGGALAAGRAGSTVVDLTRPGRFRVARAGVAAAETAALLRAHFGLAEDPT
jgi:2',5'-phosphodiesterase